MVRVSMTSEFINENKHKMLTDKASFEKTVIHLLTDDVDCISVEGLTRHERHLLHKMQKKDLMKTVSCGTADIRVIYIYLSEEYIKFLVDVYNPPRTKEQSTQTD